MKAEAAAKDRGGVEGLIEGLRRKYGGRITSELVLPAREGCYSDLPKGLEPRLVQALRKRGIQSLYTHQRRNDGHFESRPSMKSAPKANATGS